MGKQEKVFPDGMTPLENSSFTFACHPGVSCFTVCCKKVDMTLYPYDIIRLKNKLKIDSESFVRNYTVLVRGENPFFPSLKLQLDDQEQCPFLSPAGCTVYVDRPSACRMYPLERAVDRSTNSDRPDEFYFLTNHSYCKGHEEQQAQTVKNWIRSQDLIDFNLMNDLWTEIDTLFHTNPWKGEGVGGEKQQIAFMVSYNIDGFRNFCRSNGLLKRFNLDKNLRRRIERDDAELQKFGFEWLKLILTGRSRLLML